MEIKRLEKDVGCAPHDIESQRNEQVARSEAECRMHEREGRESLGCVDAPDANGVRASRSPSFLVRNSDNVNAQLYWARGLLTMWDFLEHKVRIGRMHVLLSGKEDCRRVRVMPVSCHSRYFDEGRLYISRRIKKRLGRYERVRGLMVTLTYDPKKMAKQEAWGSFGRDTRRFLNGVNQYRKRRGWRRTHYLWVVEPQAGTGYPHVHIFLPNLKYLAPLTILKGNWRRGRSNIEAPKKIVMNCAGYISKYLRKMESWSDLHLALLWSGHCRMYGFSRGFSAKIEKKESEWRRWCVLDVEEREALEKSLEEGGFVVDRGHRRDCENSPGGAATGSQALTVAGWES